MSDEQVSRRSFFLGSIIAAKAVNAAVAAAVREDTMQVFPPPKATVVTGFLAARLQWKYASEKSPHNITLSLSSLDDPKHPIVRVVLRGDETTYGLPLVPNQSYAWELQPRDACGQPTFAPVRGTFTTGAIRLLQDALPEEKYKNPRKGARYSPYKAMPFAAEEPLSPWYEVKRYAMAPPPRFDAIKDQLPHPVLDGHADALETYWYCWETFVDEWNYAPAHAGNQAIANINGCFDWAGWGSSQVWDSFCMMHYARYGHQAYPFITQYDNVYARQHENGFICQESDNDNREVYACDPALCPYLIAWAELDYYQVSGDMQRLRRVFMPLVKNYEWFMTYMRHEPDGIYGFVTPATRDTCGTDGFDLPMQATAFRAAETLAMARISTLVGRPDMTKFFTAEHQRLGSYINRHHWDSEYQLYNERCDPNFLCIWAKYRDPHLKDKFITEPIPGDINKSVGTFLPLFAEIASPERMRILRRLLQDSKKGFEWANGIEGYSLDSSPQGPVDDTGAASAKIWPPVQYIVQQGFKQYGDWAVAQEVAERYLTAVVAAYKKSNMIREALNAKQPEFVGHKSFVGWGGLAPIANLIEYVLGFEISVPKKTMTWHISRLERHGIQNLKFGDFYVELICDGRQKANEPCRISVNSGGSFSLRVVVNGKTTETQIRKGTATVRVT
jgi:hypothetical protein